VEQWENVTAFVLARIQRARRLTPARRQLLADGLRGCLVQARRRQLCAQANLLLHQDVALLADALERSVRALLVAAVELERAGLSMTARFIRQAAEEAKRALP
jgi:hypothetical protein